jgi:hypothetical protein
VLNGVGGTTIAEAKERMSYAEALAWSQYVRKYGSLHLGRRLELGFALITTALNNAYGGTAKIHDYMPHYEPPEATVEDVMKILTGASR